MASLFSTTSGVAVVDTRTRSGTITLPLTTQIPNRYLQIKDLYGAFARSSLTLSTQGGERFDDGTTSKVFTDPFTFFTLYAASTTRWAQLGGTQTIQQTVSSLIVSSLTIGSGYGWLQLPPIQTIYASTVITQAQALYSLSSYFGGTSTATTLEYWGLFGNYNNTVLAEVSTGAGTQEFLVFKGSSASDRVRVQTTGTFVVETGVSARLWNDNTTATLSNATPAFIINTSSNVGIQTATPGATLDVAGTARAVILSSQQLFMSSLNSDVPIVRANEISTVVGLGTAGYVSTASMNSSITAAISSFSTALGTVGGGSLTLNNLTSTVTGLGATGYISSSQLVSTTLGLQTYISSFIDPTELTSSILSTVVGIGLQSNLTSTVTGLGSANYVSTASLASTTQFFQTAGFVSAPNLLNLVSTTFLNSSLASTITGLGSANYVSSASLVSTTLGLQTYISTFIDPTELTSSIVSTVIGIGLQSNLTSTVTGLGSAGFVSTASLTSTVRGLGQLYLSTPPLTLSTSALLTSSLTASTITTSSLQVNSLTIGTGTGWVNLGPLQTVAISSIQDNTNALYANTSFFGTTSTITGLQFYGLFGNYNNTVVSEISTGAGTQEFLVFKGSSATDRIRMQTTGTFVVETGVSARLWDTTTTQTLSNATPAFIVNASSNVGIQTANPGATLDVAGTARAVTFSSQQLFVSSVNGGLPLATSNITSTVVGLGTSGYVSTASLASTTFALQTAGFVSAPNLLNLVSTTFLNSSLASTTFGLQTAGFVSAPNLLNLVSTTYLQSQLTSTVTGLGSANYVSSASLASTTQFFQTAGFVSAPNLLNLVSTTFLNTSLVSTVTGLGATGYISSSQLVSTTLGLQSFISTFIDPTELTSSIVSTVIGIGLQSNLVSTVTGLGSANYVSTASLVSTTLFFQTAGFVSAPNLLNLVSTTFLNTSLASTVTGLGSAGYVSTASLVSTVSWLTRFPILPPFLSSFTVSTGAATASSLTVITATVSTTATISSLIVNSLQFGDGTGWINLGPTQTSYISSIQANTNTLYANQTFLGTTSSATAIQFYGLTGLYQNTVIAEVSTGAGTQELLMFKGSSASDRIRMQTTGTFVIETGVSARAWSNTTIPTTSNVTPAFIITTSSNVGIQTASPGATLDVAGTARAVTLSSQQLFFSSLNGGLPLATSNITSTVVGLGTSGYVSTASLTSTTFGLQTAGFVSAPNLLNLVSTTFLNTSLASTTFGLQTAGFVSAPNLLTLVSTTFLNTSLVSTVAGLGTAGYVSTLSLTSSLVSTTNSIAVAISSFSTAFGPGGTNMDTITSTVAGLGTVGYVSTASLTSTTRFFQTAGFVSAPNLLNLVSTAFLNTSLASTVAVLQQGVPVTEYQIASTLQYAPVFSNVIIGYNAGFTNPGPTVIAIGCNAGYDTQGDSAIAIGYQAGYSNQAGYTIAMGWQAGMSNQAVDAIAIGDSAGWSNQGTNAVAIGVVTGYGAQGDNTVAIGTSAAYANQEAGAIALGFQAGNVGQQSYAIAIGSNAGQTTQGSNAIAIGALAGYNTQTSNSIILNATGLQLDSATDGFFVAPVRDITGSQTGLLGYNAGTSEVGTVDLYDLVSTPYLQSKLVSTVGGLGSAFYVSTTYLSNAIQNLLIPYSGYPPDLFQLQAKGTELFFGSLGSTAQIYMGDIQAAGGYLSLTDPVLVLEQKATYVAGSQSFSYTGVNQLFTVPAGVTEVDVFLFGAGGGTEITSNYFGGSGGRVGGKLAVVPGETLTVIVGQGGNHYATGTYGGGGIGGPLTPGGYVGDGGGRSAIRRGGSDIVTAGGGGGSGPNGAGGAGGGTTGAAGAGTNPGFGGSQVSGGAAGGGTATAGSLSTGGNGDGTGNGGAGGGGGYYGGGGGDVGDGAGGGSSYVANLTGSVTNTQGGGSAAETDGSVSITWAVNAYRPGNLLEIINYQTSKVIVDPFLHTGINVSSINSNYYLDVSGGARVSSLALGTVNTVGNLGTDTTGNLFWNDVQINTGGGSVTPAFVSTVQGLGTAGYVSTLSMNSSIVASISSFSTALGPVGGGGVTVQNLTSTVTGLGTVGYLSSGGQGLFSSLYVNLNPATAPPWDSNTPQYAGFDTEPAPLALDVFGSVRVLKNLYIGSTTTVIGTTGLRTRNISLNTLSAGTTVVSSLGILNPTNSQAFYLANSNGTLIFNNVPLATGDLGSTIAGLGTLGYISTPTLNSTTQFFRTAGFVSAPNLLNLVSTTFLNISLASTVNGLGTAGYVTTSNLVSTTVGVVEHLELLSTVTGLGTLGYVSTLSMNSSITAAISSLSTAYGAIGGGGGGGITTLPTSISSLQLFTSSLLASSIQSIVVSTVLLNASSFTIQNFTVQNLNTSTMFASTFSTSQINFASGFGYLTMPDIYPNTVYTSTVTTSNLLVGVNQTISPIQFFGFGSYLNSILSELSTGTTTQELVFFRGSNASDRIRMQTTGNFVVETGVSARLWPTAPSNITPAFIINTSSNVGIQTAAPVFPLDVAGVIRGTTLSTQQVQTSSIVGFPVPVIQGAFFNSSFRVGLYSTFFQGAMSTSFMTGGSNEIDFFTNNLLRMTILNSGNVGIGLANPTFFLDVAGAGRTTGLSTLQVQLSSLNGNVYVGNATTTSSLASISQSSGTVAASTFTGKWNDAQYYVLQTI